MFQNIFFILLIIAVTGCGSNSSSSISSEKTSPSTKAKKYIKITSRSGAKYNQGQEAKVTIKLKQDEVAIDSIDVQIARQTIAFRKVTDIEYRVNTKNLSMGKNHLDITFYLSNGLTEQKRTTIIVLSDIIPKKLGYRTINTFPHDRQAFTQGLTFSENRLYESTGQRGQSQLREININTGSIVRSIDLPNRYFGEGNAIIGNEVFVVTWTSREGFVYDKNTFSLLRTINYNTEGWGLTNIGDTLLMTDSTEKLHFKEKEGFTDLKTIEIYDNQGPIDQLNELEYIDGYLYANRWMTDYIYKIDIKTGKVIAVIDLSDLLPTSSRSGTEDVLNGIAFNPVTNRLYVTGKLWPSLFEIEIVD